MHTLADVTVKVRVQWGCKVGGEHLSALSFPLKCRRLPSSLSIRRRD